MLSARTRLGQAEPWVGQCGTKEMFRVVPVHGAADAEYVTLLLAEQCHMRGEDDTGRAADIYKCFDQIARPPMYKLLREAEMAEK